ncbi:poly alpha-glucosyltransferase [Enterococcus sp. LJL90]
MRITPNFLEKVKYEITSRLANEQDQTVIFLSMSNGVGRAKVWNTKIGTLADLWPSIDKYLSKNKMMPKWLKIDVLDSNQDMTFQQLLAEIDLVERNNYFRKGIAFDPTFKAAFLEEEINGNAFLKPDKDHVVGQNRPHLNFDFQNVNAYMKQRYTTSLRIDLSKDSHVCLFTTKSFFFDSGEYFDLENGVRKITDKTLLSTCNTAIEKGVPYLEEQIQKDGKYIYGYFPAFNHQLTSYNVIRHFSSIYALLEGFEYLHNENFNQINAAIDWGIANLVVEKGEDAFVVDRYTGRAEIRLGANAMIILALSKYEEVTGSSQYRELLTKIINGVRHHMVEDDLSTIHVLDENLETLEKFRIVYYDGEILFALARFYSLTQDEHVEKLIHSIANRLIEKNYYKYHDHWLAYAVNEISLFWPSEELYRFGLRNVVEHLNFIEKRDTAYPTMLELLVAAQKMVDKIATSQYAYLLNEYPKAYKIADVMEKRCQRQLERGTFFPEVAMYFKRPDIMEGGFYCRHDRFRSRIDDAEHFLSGFINFAAYRQAEVASSQLPVYVK